MVIMKVFDRLMGAVTLNIKKLKENFVFLLTIVLGMGIGVILSAKVLTKCFENFYVQTQFFFMGVVLGSLPMIYRIATEKKKFSVVHIIPFLIGIGTIIGVTVASMSMGANSVRTTLDVGTFFYLVVVLIIAAAAMIMPGLSGSLVLLILGGYQTVIQAVDEMNIPILIPAGIGIIIGIVLCAKLITICLKKWFRGTYAVILGLICGSFFAIWPREDPGTKGSADFEFNTTGIIAIIIGIIGVMLPLSMDIIDRKKNIASNEKETVTE